MYFISANPKQPKRAASLSSSRTISTHHVSDSDQSDTESQSNIPKHNTSSTNKKSSGERNTMKRKHSSEHRQRCPYGMKCYRKNPSHFEEMVHPSG